MWLAPALFDRHHTALGDVYLRLTVPGALVALPVNFSGVLDAQYLQVHLLNAER